VTWCFDEQPVPVMYSDAHQNGCRLFPGRVDAGLVRGLGCYDRVNNALCTG
jgi:hypothetical protein